MKNYPLIKLIINILLNNSTRFFESYIKDFKLNLNNFLDVYDDLEENLEIPDHFKRKNISQQNVLDMVMFTKLYISPKGRIAWLAEAPTDEEDGIAFEFTNGEIKLITQPEII